MIFRLFIIGLMVLLAQPIAEARAETKSMEAIGQAAIRLAWDRLHIRSGDTDLACLTNAGAATLNGRGTRPLLDILPRLANIGIGRGNLLPVHDRRGAAPYLAFVKKGPDKALMMVLVRPTEQGMESTAAIDVRVDKGTSFKPFETAFGQKAFALVTLANGWADGIPEDLLSGSLFHDHLCCGVFSGYHTLNFIERQIPLADGERYLYIGAPAWCQDDYLVAAMNLTPGKHGYYTMAYPWDRPWQTGEKTYDRLGGIVIRFNDATATGWAYLLRYDWRWREFMDFLQMPGVAPDWKAQPWLHVCYNRFSMQHLDHPDFFVSVITRTRLESKKDLERLTHMGANPLAVMLGPDPAWQ